MNCSDTAGFCLFYQNTIKGAGTEAGDGVIYTCRCCNSDEATPWCTDCRIKTSSRKKEIKTCSECDAYPCDVLTAFMNDPDYPTTETYRK